MISDVLSEAVDEIDEYLESPTYLDMYSGELRVRILELRGRMDAMRRELDTPPPEAVDEGLDGVRLAAIMALRNGTTLAEVAALLLEEVLSGLPRASKSAQ